jgi:hypothetical protein
MSCASPPRTSSARDHVRRIAACMRTSQLPGALFDRSTCLIPSALFPTASIQADQPTARTFARPQYAVRRRAASKACAAIVLPCSALRFGATTSGKATRFSRTAGSRSRLGHRGRIPLEPPPDRTGGALVLRRLENVGRVGCHSGLSHAADDLPFPELRPAAKRVRFRPPSHDGLALFVGGTSRVQSPFGHEPGRKS